VNLNNARKIKEFPIPFPLAQMIMVMLFFHAIITPIICAATVQTTFWAAVITFMVTFSYWSILYIAVELEMPFGDDKNDLPLKSMAEDMNKSLKALVRNPLAQKVPAFGFVQDVHEQLGMKVINLDKEVIDIEEARSFVRRHSHGMISLHGDYDKPKLENEDEMPKSYTPSCSPDDSLQAATKLGKDSPGATLESVAISLATDKADGDNQTVDKLPTPERLLPVLDILDSCPANVCHTSRPRPVNSPGPLSFSYLAIPPHSSQTRPADGIYSSTRQQQTSQQRPDELIDGLRIQVHTDTRTVISYDNEDGRGMQHCNGKATNGVSLEPQPREDGRLSWLRCDCG